MSANREAQPTKGAGSRRRGPSSWRMLVAAVVFVGLCVILREMYVAWQINEAAEVLEAIKGIRPFW